MPCGTPGAGNHSGETQEQGGQAGGIGDLYRPEEVVADERTDPVPCRWSLALQGGTTGGGGE